MTNHITLKASFKLLVLFVLVFVQTSVLTSVALKLLHGDLQSSLIVLGMLFPVIWTLLWTYTSYRPRHLLWWSSNIGSTLFMGAVVLLLKPVA